MRVVLYADDMEPITVIDLPAFAEEFLSERGVVRIAVQPPISFTPQECQSMPPHMPIVTIISERFIRRGQKHMMLFTNDEESALLLKCAFLPGQQAGLQERDRKAFARGFLDALYRMGAA
jgi:hypothetical protein